MDLMTIILAATTLLVMAVVLTYILGWADKAFHVEVDPRVEDVIEALPGVNCGGCGYIGCSEYAEAVVLNAEVVNKCTVGGPNCTEELAQIMGVEAESAVKLRAIIHCGANYEQRLGRSKYKGEQRCIAANLVTDVQGCIFGCLGFGDCKRSCDYGAINIVDGLSRIDYEKCVGCGACSKICPRNIITITAFTHRRMLAVECSNTDKLKEVTKVCTVGCLGCGACTRVSDMFFLQNNLSTIKYDEYGDDRMDELIKASEKCPKKRIIFMGPPLKEGEKDEDQKSDKVITPDFKTTVDDTEWRG
jgi:RnfABCDGE-type electron transport complex B subunit